MASDDVVTLAADLVLLGGAPGAGAKLRDEHGPDRDGRCRGCPHAGTVAPMFPCLLRLVGAAAATREETSDAGEDYGDDH